MNIIWEQGELAGPRWDARIEPPNGNSDYFMLNVWLASADDGVADSSATLPRTPHGHLAKLPKTAAVEWAWEVVYHADDFDSIPPQVTASGMASTADMARWSALIGFGNVLRDSDEVDFRPDEHPVDRYL